eukprot:Tbor_TRINITY_DN8337_c0_g1::TRINITY_DN8337_c0_g1_i1::g.21079::m.21079
MRRVITSYRERVVSATAVTADISTIKSRWFSSPSDGGDKNSNTYKVSPEGQSNLPKGFDDDSDLLDEHGVPKKLSAKKIEEVYFVRRANIEQMQQVYNAEIHTEMIDDVVVLNLPPLKSKSTTARTSPATGEDPASLELDTEIDIFGEKSVSQQSYTGSDAVSPKNTTSVISSGKHSKNADMVLDQYKRTTMSFVSNVEPDGIIGIGMGAGFGEMEDKRLGFLRPRKKDDSITASTDDDENKDIAHLPDEEKEKYLSPKTPEEKRIAKQRQLRKNQEQIASSLKKMNAFKGTTFSPNEHFLLVDLDYDRDSLLFGNTREEFEQNVRKMKTIIVEYTHWERRDNFYMWGTWILKIFFCYAVYDTWCSWRIRSLLMDSYDDFATIVTEDIDALGKRMESDLERAREELRLRPPDFQPLKQAIEKEKVRIRAEKEAQRVIKEEENRIIEEASKRLRGITAEEGSDGEAASADVISKAMEISRKGNKTHHPMDTSGAQEAEDEARMDKLKDDLMKYSELANLSPLMAHQGSNDRKATEGKGIISSTWQLTKDIFTFSGFRRGHAEQQQKYISETTGESTTSSAEKLGSQEAPVRSLTALEKQEEDERILAGMAYAVAPTSIDAVKAVRRLILPRSDDFAYIVRQEMLEYKAEKLAKMNFPR